ncbi:MAG: type II 3-dehydroquinate dehydratase [Fibrella sp.]|nr:type II 3-dehydroquinate dehydratase [Armatimonadota bacterium]
MPETNLAAVRVLVLHGPNLNMLGMREPGVYGSQTLADVDGSIRAHANAIGAVIVDCLQSNQEGALMDAIHKTVLQGSADAIVLNPGAYTHYSHAIADAIRAVSDKIVVVEVHLSNVHAREEFRRHSVIAPAATGQIAGFGADSYLLGVSAAVAMVQKKRNPI